MKCKNRHYIFNLSFHVCAEYKFYRTIVRIIKFNIFNNKICDFAELQHALLYNLFILRSPLF